MNNQPILKQNLSHDGSLSVHSIFRTIQGEGPFVGTPAIFVRLHGCNLQCPLCDTDYTVNPLTTISAFNLTTAVIKMLGPGRITLVVITGGEPFRQNLTPFVNGLLGLVGVRVQIETNGTLFLPRGNGEDPGFPYGEVTIVCSPKTGKINKYLVPHIDAYKYVLTAGSVDEADGLPLRALEHSVHKKLAKPQWSGVSPGGSLPPVYIQPTDSGDAATNNENRRAAIASCMEFGYTLCVQIHKIIGMD